MDEHRLERVLTRLQDLDEPSVLHRICVVCVDLTSTTGAGISRILDGSHAALAASGPVANDIEQLQVRFEEGPCVDAVGSFKRWFEPDLASSRATRRWPRFSPAALDHGVAAAFAFPLMTGGVAIGALDVYASQPGDLRPEWVADAEILAGLATIAVEGEGRQSVVAGVALSAEAPQDWAHAAVVHQASGIVSEQLGIDVEHALLRLRAVSFASERRVDQVARDIVARRLRLESWAEHE